MNIKRFSIDFAALAFMLSAWVSLYAIFGDNV